jgi:hypothetical protein
MPSHRLTLHKNRRDGQWLIEWDSRRLAITSPRGQMVCDVPTEEAHRLFDLYELDAEKRISLPTAVGQLTFARDAAAAHDVRELITQGLRGDPEFREEQVRRARRLLPIGLCAFVVCGGLFGLYCWWASWAPDPPEGHWIHMLGPLIHMVLLLLLGTALAGPYIIYLALKQLRRVRRAERVRTSI